MRNRVDAESTDGYAAAAALVRAKDGSGFVRWMVYTHVPPFFSSNFSVLSCFVLLI
jgi:hypothetical protein